MNAKQQLDQLQAEMRKEAGIDHDGVTAPDYHNATCDYCKAKAIYDAATIDGIWAFMCDAHFAQHTHKRLGLGFGQRLIPMSEINN